MIQGHAFFNWRGRLFHVLRSRCLLISASSGMNRRNCALPSNPICAVVPGAHVKSPRKWPLHCKLCEHRFIVVVHVLSPRSA